MSKKKKGIGLIGMIIAAFLSIVLLISSLVFTNIYVQKARQEADIANIKAAYEKAKASSVKTGEVGSAETPVMKHSGEWKYVPAETVGEWSAVGSGSKIVPYVYKGKTVIVVYSPDGTADIVIGK